MKDKIFLIVAALTSAFIMGIIGAFNYQVDPLHYYRTDTFYIPQYDEKIARYQIPGLIKDLEFNAIMLGTSMARNFTEEHMDEHMDEHLGLSSFNASIASGKVRELSMVAKMAIEHQLIEKIFWELNMSSFEGKANEVAEVGFPTYMYDGLWVTDFRYLVNWDTLVRSYEVLQEYENYESVEIHEVYKFGAGVPPRTINDLRPIEHTETDLRIRNRYKADTKIRNFQRNVLPIIEANPNIEFTFFYVPYPIDSHLYFYNLNNKYLDERAEFKERVLKLVISYDNVRVFDFQADYEITHHISNYMDAVHYYPTINNQLFERMVKEQPLTSVQRQQELNEMLHEQVTNLTIDLLTED